MKFDGYLDSQEFQQIQDEKIRIGTDWHVIAKDQDLAFDASFGDVPEIERRSHAIRMAYAAQTHPESLQMAFEKLDGFEETFLKLKPVRLVNGWRVNE